MIAVICPDHRFKVLSLGQFRRQRLTEGYWRCPVSGCGRPCEADEVPPGLLAEAACAECGQPLPDGPVGPILDQDVLCLFCDELCRGVYRAKINGKLAKHVRPGDDLVEDDMAQQGP
jgi:hypothetical protein